MRKLAVEIPYKREMEFEYGQIEQVAPGVRRVIANNPSAFTFHGTGTYILGEGEVAVIDPGPLDPNHIEAIFNGIKGERVTHVLITHTHMDHSPGYQLMKARCNAVSYGYGPHGSGKVDDGVKVEEGGDMQFYPDERVAHGDLIEGANWSIECVYTPGHTSNHVCYQLKQGKALFTGDHVMGWSTTIVSPPDGDMESYMSSLELLLKRDDSVYWPTHGPAITEPKEHVSAFIAHRKAREEQILKCVDDGVHVISEMVPKMYQGTPEFMYPAAARSVAAAVEYLIKRGVLVSDHGNLMEARVSRN